MKRIVNSQIKMSILALCLAQAPLSCALDQTGTTGKAKAETQVMTNQKNSCKSNSIVKSQGFINFMLNDILSTYTHTGGGGISSIKEIVTHTYEVSISQEERIDVLTYELAIDDDCTVTLIKKSEATVSFGQ